MEAVLSSVRAALARYAKAGDAICVGLSGGMDSVVLLHALVLLRRDAALDHPLAALHVHHGLSPQADEWAAFCEALCARWDVPCQVHRARVMPDGEGVEAAARAVRYAAYARSAARWLLLAHHADDQVETLVLRLSRGTGLRGLSGMPDMRSTPAGPSILRPLLGLERCLLRAHARAHALTWVDDESNMDQRLDRNYVRHTVLPPLAARFPAWRANWLRTARHAAEALSLLDERAAEDAGPEPLPSLARLRALSSARLQNLLRWLVARRGEGLPDAAQLADVERCLRTCATDATLGIRFGGSALFQYRGRLHWAPATRLEAPRALSRPIAVPGEGGLAWLVVPELRGELRLSRVEGAGISLARLRAAGLRLHGPEPGAVLRLHPQRPRRALKNLWQEAAVPPWERDWLPRLSVGRELAWVAGLGLACGLIAGEGEPGLLPEWRPLD